MIRYYKTVNLKLERINDFEPECWINISEPTSNEIDDMANLLDIEVDILSAALDDEESSRIEYDENYTMLIIDIPFDMSDTELSLIHI